ncbi:hypothetical protein BpHYR1_022061 [Brachionus plicatilis]|uniref:Uncharacterized protein n=1 Tax=Brachionus plicatilis TaxID=10195 RepID=A0A3M7PII9_BRAPC|nr:hypothetical protein BpHYR1_022061 [Brachionus plicatilis]
MFYFHISILLCLYQSIQLATIMGENFSDAQRMERPDDQLIDSGQLMSQNLAKDDRSDLEKLFANRVINKRAQIFGGNFDRANIFRKKRATIMGGNFFDAQRIDQPRDRVINGFGDDNLVIDSGFYDKFTILRR